MFQIINVLLGNETNKIQIINTPDITIEIVNIYKFSAEIVYKIGNCIKYYVDDVPILFEDKLFIKKFITNMKNIKNKDRIFCELYLHTFEFIPFNRTYMHRIEGMPYSKAGSDFCLILDETEQIHVANQLEKIFM